MDLMKRWNPTESRREILILSDGIDRFRGDPFSPDIPATYQAAQKAGIILHTIFVNCAGRHGRNMWRINLGQSNLSEITDETGGESYFQGSRTPVDMAPFLDDLHNALNSQYWLTFEAPAKKKAGLQSVKISTELPGVEIAAPDSVYVPAAP
jgi:hypothetical protein